MAESPRVHPTPMHRTLFASMETSQDEAQTCSPQLSPVALINSGTRVLDDDLFVSVYSFEVAL